MPEVTSALSDSRLAERDTTAETMRADLAKAQANVKTITREVVREIPATAHCPDLSGFVQHNPNADLPADPPSPGGSEVAGPGIAPDPGPSARDLAEALGLAESFRAEVIAWREWYAQVVK